MTPSASPQHMIHGFLRCLRQLPKSSKNSQSADFSSKNRFLLVFVRVSDEHGNSCIAALCPFPVHRNPGIIKNPHDAFGVSTAYDTTRCYASSKLPQRCKNSHFARFSAKNGCMLIFVRVLSVRENGPVQARPFSGH